MSDDSITERLPFVRGAAAGAGAYLLGYLLTYLWQSDSIREQLEGYNAVASAFGGDPVAAWKGVGWLFYNAHFVSLQVESFGGTQSANIIAGSDGGALVVLYILPVVLLLGAGALLARGENASLPNDGAIAGAAVVAGYLPLAAVGAFLFAHDTAAPNPITAVLLAGLVYPAVLGALGGVFASAFGE